MILRTRGSQTAARQAKQRLHQLVWCGFLTLEPALAWAWLAVAGGCSSARPAAESGPRADQPPFRALADSGYRAIEHSFDQLAAGHVRANAGEPGPAPLGCRWADVPLAVILACDDASMAVTGTIEHEWGYEFGLKAIEGYAGMLLVRRTGDNKVYQASATLGRFEDHSDRAAQLIAALERQMRALGKKRQFNE